MKQLTSFGIAVVALVALMAVGCGDSGPSNEDVLKTIPKDQINTNPNSPTAVQPRDMTGHPITIGKGGPKGLGGK